MTAAGSECVHAASQQRPVSRVGNRRAVWCRDGVCVTPLDDATLDALAERALAARQRAYAPYSRFVVGAALLCDDGSVIDGCNVENASYGLCICAERTAVAAAVAGGRRRFRAIAIATASEPPAAPCGMCRQVLAEFTPATDDLVIVLANDRGGRVRTSLRAIFPGVFDQAQLQSGQTPPSTTEPA
jgi:cytidine deaminase